jgi:hypothetical protein
VNRSSYAARDARPRRVVIALWIVSILIAFGVGIVLGGGDNGDQPPGTNPAPTASATSRPSVLNGVPVGYELSEEGAVAAATNFAQIMAGPSRDAERYRNAMQTLAAPSWRDRALELASNAIDFAERRYGPGASIGFHPLRYKVEDYSDSAATIQLWGVVVASGPKVAGVEESWVTATVHLSRVDDDWRVSGQTSAAGPTPRLLAGQDSTPVSVLNGFEEFGRAHP